MRIQKGKIIFTVQDYENLRKEEIDGKMYYVLYTKQKEQVVITKEEFEKQLSITVVKKNIEQHFGVNAPQLNLFLDKTYGTTKINEIIRLVPSRTSSGKEKD